MKAATQTCVRNTEYGIKQEKLLKPKHEDTTEMQQCFSKLKDLVPSVPKDIKLSKTQLLQHVIDYILDLESTLDVPAVLASASCRSPLSEKCQPNVIGDGLNVRTGFRSLC
ncbi:DNA-binding protein inhibitor ID-2-like [Mytilus trossulus]|uniref:DNA-binding protein inhibitor ID-2-like n=1 Tax=Mytilus trossulus TaxID=6551 RepID=UPI003005CD83